MIGILLAVGVVIVVSVLFVIGAALMTKVNEVIG